MESFMITFSEFITFAVSKDVKKEYIMRNETDHFMLTQPNILTHNACRANAKNSVIYQAIVHSFESARKLRAS